jgi:uncharacterized protein YqgV (UPF0045/DUF77 family)
MLVQFSVRPVQTLQDLHGARLEAMDRDDSAQRGAISARGEGPWEQVMAAIKGCHQSVAHVHSRVVTTILVVDDRDDSEEPSRGLDRERQSSIRDICVI